MNTHAQNAATDPTQGWAENTHPRLKALLASSDVSTRAIDAFMSGLVSPLVVPGALTFLWRGEANSLELLRWIHSGVNSLPFQRLTGSDLWALTVPVQDGGRFEYKLKVVHDDREDWILDAMNPNRAGDPFGENSVAMTFGYAAPEWSRDIGVPRGQIEELKIDSAVFEGTRTERVYLPDGYDAKKVYPLVVIHDGGDYEDYADLTVSLDNLIHAGDIPPLIAVLITADDRMSEYSKGRNHARYVAAELLPVVESNYSVSPKIEERILLGASLGAVASLATAFRFRGVFGGLILKSGSFVLDPSKLKLRPHPVFRRAARLVEVVRRAPALEGTRAFISTGELEGLAQDNAALADLLRESGVEVMFKSSWDGHHWHNWRDQLKDALIWVLERDHIE